MKNITHLKTSQIKIFRNKLYKQNSFKCPILKVPLNEKDSVLDHIHKRKQTDEISENYGVIRNTIHNGANAFLGKIENAFIRYIPKDTITLPELLRNLADYVEKGQYVENNTIFSHPKENGNGDLLKMKKIPFHKTKYKKLCDKMLEAKKKPLKYNKFLTTKIQNLLNEYKVD